MATSGAIAEFSRMPTDRKVLVFVLIGALLGVVYWKLAYKSLDEQLEAAEAEHDSKLATSKRLAADIPKYEELRSHLVRLRELIEKNQTALPTAPELPAFFETLQHKVAESGVEIRKWSNRPEEPVESFIKVPVEIEIAGTFMQIKRFFASLVQRDVRLGQSSDDRANEDHERVVSIENLALTSLGARNREVVLSAKFTAVTFRQEDKPASHPAAVPPGQAPPAAAAPSRPPASAPPLPSAASPAGAGARGAAGASDPGAPGAPSAGKDRLKGGL